MATLKRQNPDGTWTILQLTGRNVEEIDEFLHLHSNNNIIHLTNADREKIDNLDMDNINNTVIQAEKRAKEYTDEKIANSPTQPDYGIFQWVFNSETNSLELLVTIP